jgi:hypothetical protein
VTLTEFLLTRIAEDEAVARAAEQTWDSDRDGGWWVGCDPDTQAHIARHDPARVLTECEAKRAIVELISSPGPQALRLLALPYADHADYQPEWTL